MVWLHVPAGGQWAQHGALKQGVHGVFGFWDGGEWDMWSAEAHAEVLLVVGVWFLQLASDSAAAPSAM
jgi:hypothetical protein